MRLASTLPDQEILLSVVIRRAATRRDARLHERVTGFEDEQTAHDCTGFQVGLLEASGVRKLKSYGGVFSPPPEPRDRGTDPDRLFWPRQP